MQRPSVGAGAAAVAEEGGVGAPPEKTTWKEGSEVAGTFPLSIKIFADGADLEKMLELARNPQISGFTTNPTLMRQSGVTDYVRFAHQVLEHITDRPISFEVFSDEFDEMERQAHTLSSWGANVYVKIPITNTKG